MCLGYVIGLGELKIDPTKMEADMKWSMPTNVFEVKSFLGAIHYLRKFITSFSIVVPPISAITSGKTSNGRRFSRSYFEELEEEN